MNQSKIVTLKESYDYGCRDSIKTLFLSSLYSPGLDMLLWYESHPEYHFLVMLEDADNAAPDVMAILMGRSVFDTADIDYIAVDSARKSKGLGRELVDHFSMIVLNGGCKRILLEVNIKNNSAISFYSRQGFQTISTRKNYYGDKEDALIMEKSL
jgi:ribosomal protein S18 acetylase RimI-like enzyme